MVDIDKVNFSESEKFKAEILKNLAYFLFSIPGLQLIALVRQSEYPGIFAVLSGLLFAYLGIKVIEKSYSTMLLRDYQYGNHKS